MAILAAKRRVAERFGGDMVTVDEVSSTSLHLRLSDSTPAREDDASLDQREEEDDLVGTLERLTTEPRGGPAPEGATSQSLRGNGSSQSQPSFLKGSRQSQRFEPSPSQGLALMVAGKSPRPDQHPAFRESPQLPGDVPRARPGERPTPRPASHRGYVGPEEQWRPRATPEDQRQPSPRDDLPLPSLRPGETCPREYCRGDDVMPELGVSPPRLQPSGVYLPALGDPLRRSAVGSAGPEVQPWENRRENPPSLQPSCEFQPALGRAGPEVQPWERSARREEPPQPVRPTPLTNRLIRVAILYFCFQRTCERRSELRSWWWGIRPGSPPQGARARLIVGVETKINLER